MLIVDALISIAPLIGYYSQYNLIKTNKSVGSFSIDLCGILFLSNILRIFFWFTNGYAINLFLQSFIIIAMQVALLKLCVDLGYKKMGEKRGFWRWDSFNEFMEFLLCLVLALIFLTIFCRIENTKYFGNLLGFLSLSIQATIGFPQFVSNQVAGSVKGLSIFMITTWIIGDLFKTIYYIHQQQPYQFIVSGFIQIIIDILIILQIIIFTNKKQYKSIDKIDHLIISQIQSQLSM